MPSPIRAFAALALIFGLAFLITTPPLRYPDESGHFLRAVAVTASLTGGSGDTVRLRQDELADFSYFSSRIVEVARGKPYAIGEFTSRVPVLIPAAPAPEISLTGAQMMVYHAIAYLPQALGVAAARAGGASFVLSLWAARLGALIAAVAITLAALALMPAWSRGIAALVGLIPMAVYLRGSAAPDAVITAVALLGVAALLRTLARNALDVASLAILLAVSLFLALAKPPYLCFLLLTLAWMRPSFRGVLALRAAAIVTLVALAFAVAAWHASEVHQYASTVRLDIPPSAFARADKWAMLRSSPLSVAMIALRTLATAPVWLYSLIARFGWADINPPPLLHALTLVWVAAIVFAWRREIANNLAVASALLMLATFAAQVALVSFSIWLFYTATASPVIQSIQGRHFLPLAICGVLGVAGLVCRRVKAGTPSDPRRDRLLAGGAAVLLFLALVFSVLGEYRGAESYRALCWPDICAAKPQDPP